MVNIRGNTVAATLGQRVRERRARAAQEAIDRAGGCRALSNALSKHLGREVGIERVRKWRYNGIPPEWGVLVCHLVPEVSRETLNPWEYTTDLQFIHNPGIPSLLRITMP